MTQKPDLTLDNLEEMLEDLILEHGRSYEDLTKIQQIIHHAQQFCEGVIEGGQKQIYDSDAVQGWNID